VECAGRKPGFAVTVRTSAVPIVLCWLFVGCRLVTDCTYESRYVSASGTVVEGGSELVSAQIAVSANRGSLEWKEFSRTIAGASLIGHVSAIRLVRSDQPGVSLLDIPIDGAGSPFISSGSLIQHPADATPNLAGLYELVAAGLTSVELDTDRSPGSRISVRLSVTDKRDWFRPHNCY
jgi:hypothetical protein